MTWKPIDFFGLISLKEGVYDQLNEYLAGKEEEICKKILKLFSDQRHPEIKPPVPSAFSFHLRLSDAIESVDKYVKKLLVTKANLYLPDPASIEKQLNKILWGYVEILESVLTELFQTLEQMGYEVIRTNIIQTVDSIKIMLMHRMEQLVWAIKRLNKILKDYAKLSFSTPLKALGSFFKTFRLDSQLMENLEKSQQFLLKKYQQYTYYQSEYLKLWQEGGQKAQKLDHFLGFKILDKESQELFRKIDHFLKMIESPSFSKSPFSQEIVFSLRSLLSVDRARMLFREYYQVLLSLLFNFSYQIKNLPLELWGDVETYPLTDTALQSYKKEAIFLENLISKYRQFLLTTDANPYVRTRLGFSERIVGPEPEETKALISQIFELNTLAGWFDEMIAGFKNPSRNLNLSEWEDRLNEQLHMMGQPLISRHLLKQVILKILATLKEVGELSSRDMQAVNIVGATLAKALRLDWKYQVLYGEKDFQNLYRIHQGIVAINEDRQHLGRFQKFKKIIEHLEKWVKDKTTQKHLYEIEQDLNDIKENLQDFFMYVKRLGSFKGSLGELDKQLQSVHYQLLEYRYLFAGFFHHLRQNIAEERFFRMNFLFVDQYFESIEMILLEIKDKLHP